MTPAQIAEAQKLVRDWKPKPERQLLPRRKPVLRAPRRACPIMRFSVSCVQSIARLRTTSKASFCVLDRCNILPPIT
jgi:hypothetical protein